MRSRYTAFALGTSEAVEYLITTHHPDHRAPNLRDELRSSIAEVEAWVQLEVLHAIAKGNHGEVKFVATYLVHGRRMQLREHSEFLRVDGRWRYVRGELG